MRPLTVTLVAGAFLAASGVAFVANKMIRGAAEAAAAQRTVDARDVDVLVAARDLPPGRLMTEADLRWDKWPIKTADPARVIVRKPDQSTMAHLPGTATRRPLLAGEPIAAAAVFKPGAGTGFMAQMIAPGKKAVGVTVTAASTASGFVLPGDLVDVILTIDVQKADVALPGGGRFASQTILRAVKVLAVDQSLDPSDAKPATRRRSSRKEADTAAKDKKDKEDEADDIAIVGKTVALEVTPMEAERLAGAQAAGTLSLSLRSLAVEDAQREGLTGLRSVTGDGVKIIKGGDVVR